MLVAAAEVGNWGVILQFFYHVPFGADDPLFNKDISFYLFVLPAYILVKNWMLLTLILSALFAAAIYWVHGDIEYDIHHRSMSPTAIAHEHLKKEGSLRAKPCRKASEVDAGQYTRSSNHYL